MVDIQSYPWATAKKSHWTLKVGEQDWEQLAFLLSNFLSHIVLFGPSTPVFLFASPFSLFLLLAFPFSSFLHAASLNLFLPLFFLFSSLSFSLLVSQLQMSNPSTPPQTVQGFVYKCSLLHVCAFARAGKKVWKKSVWDYVHACHREPLSLLACCFLSRLTMKAAWMTKSEVSWWREPQQRNQLRHYLETRCLRACKSQGQPFPRMCCGRVWEWYDMKEWQNLILELPCCLLIDLITLRVLQCVVEWESKERE